MKKIELELPQIHQALSKSPLGTHLMDEELDAIIEFASGYEFHPGESIIEEKEIDQNMYLLVSGTVSVEIEENGRSVYIAALGPGEIFGEAGLFSNTERTASILAQEEVQVIQINRQGFLKSINKRPKAAVKFMFMIIFGLLGKLRGVNEELAYERKDDSSQDDIDAILAGITADKAGD